jgi:hypothetical protein
MRYEVEVSVSTLQPPPEISSHVAGFGCLDIVLAPSTASVALFLPENSVPA